MGGRLDTLRGFRKLQRLSMPPALLSDWTPNFEIFDKLEDLPARLADILPIDSLVYLELSDQMSHVYVPEDYSSSDDSDNSII